MKSKLFLAYCITFFIVVSLLSLVGCSSKYEYQKTDIETNGTVVRIVVQSAMNSTNVATALSIDTTVGRIHLNTSKLLPYADGDEVTLTFARESKTNTKTKEVETYINYVTIDGVYKFRVEKKDTVLLKTSIK